MNRRRRPAYEDRAGHERLNMPFRSEQLFPIGLGDPGMRPVHPGEVLREDFLVPMGLGANALAKALKVPAPRVNEIVRERRGVSADTAMRLARCFGGDARSWLNLQAVFDLRVAEIAGAKRVGQEITPAALL